MFVYIFIVFIGANELPHFHEGMDPMVQPSIEACEAGVKKVRESISTIDIPEDIFVGCVAAEDTQDAKEKILVEFSPTY